MNLFIVCYKGKRVYHLEMIKVMIFLRKQTYLKNMVIFVYRNWTLDYFVLTIYLYSTK